MNRKLSWTVLIGIVLVVSGMLIAFRQEDSKPRQEIVLEDGSVLRYLTTTQGTPYQLSGPKPDDKKFMKWWEFLVGKLSGKPPRQQRSRFIHANAPGNSAVFYFVRSKVSKAESNSPVGCFNGRRMWIEAIDESGFAYRPMSRRSLSAGFFSGIRLHAGSGFKDCFALDLENFPRRQRRFPIRVYIQNGDRGRIAGEFIVDNPYPMAAFSEWAASVLPATNKVEGLQFILKDIKTDRRWKPLHNSDNTESYYPNPNRKPTAWPHVDIVRNDGSSASYRLRSLKFFDPAGNSGGPYDLSPVEHVWKLQMKFYKPKDATFSNRQRLLFSDLPVPGSGEVLSKWKTEIVDGEEFCLGFLSGPGSTTAELKKGSKGIATVARRLKPAEELDLAKASKDINFPGHLHQDDSSMNSNVVREEWKSDYHLIVIDARYVPIQDDMKYLFRFTDQDGVPIAHPEDFLRGSNLDGSKLNRPDRYHYVFPLDLDESTRSINVECIVSRAMSVDFFVRSEDVLRNTL